MSEIKRLIERLCPEGVEFRKLGEVCEIKGRIGFRGYTRQDLVEESQGAISLSPSNIINGNLKFDKCTYVSWKKFEESPEIIAHEGDIVFTKTASVGKTALIKVLPKEATINPQLVLLKNIKCNNSFLSYVLKGDRFQNEVRKITGVGSVPNVPQSSLSALEIPVPPLDVQRKIVEILDHFTELEAELEARRKQYEYYRNALLSFDKVGGVRFNVEWKMLGEIGTFTRGNGLQKKDFVDSGFPCIHYGQIYTRYGLATEETITYCSEKLAEKLVKAKTGDMVIACTSENIEDVCKAVVWLGEGEAATGGHSCVFSHNQDPKYVAYYFQTEQFFNQKKKYAKGVKVIDIKAVDLAKITIPLPPLSEQQRIVGILDRFEALTNDLQSGLPAEIAARRKQYEYYREKLLTFKRKTA